MSVSFLDNFAAGHLFTKAVLLEAILSVRRLFITVSFCEAASFVRAAFLSYCAEFFLSKAGFLPPGHHTDDR